MVNIFFILKLLQLMEVPMPFLVLISYMWVVQPIQNQFAIKIVNLRQVLLQNLHKAKKELMKMTKNMIMTMKI